MVLLARPGGSFNRAILLRTLDATTVEAELDDDFHRFGVTLHHDGRQVLAVEGRSSRYPWTSCPLASGALTALKGLAVGSHPTDLYRHTDARRQCTHQFELAGLALGQAARPGRRLYEAQVEDFAAEGRRATLSRDGVRVLDWRFNNGFLVAPPALAGTPMASLDSRTLAALPPEEAEARLVLRRAIWLARGRWIDIDQTATAADLNLPGACFSYQPEIAGKGLRRHGSERDYSAGGPRLSNKEMD
ncbi:hypothetical protein QO010_004715 [Caulobacter ginsengisoli]|uniref:DUF2889 domain-containing protein n=1 Tax=Caulobacter ginsengisoli TaxID=400775 RepID=A0ABU0J0G5_9CAUL|nr:hypothetical protein [Caulobacter ginsengisoli]MDQ0466918.1 hypothetical protein [Caulobacter ginsengisoli]